MDKAMPELMFKLMSFILKCRDFIRSREIILEEVDIKPNDTILDYGCGPGSYSIIASKKVGKSGKVYALDIHRLAVKRVQKSANKMIPNNIQTICSGCATGLGDESVDVVLLYDIFHMLSDLDNVLKELSRVLKQNGILSFSDHHMKEKNILDKMTKSGQFRFLKKGKRTYSFVKNNF